MRLDRARRGGFTLLETAVTIIVLGVIAAVGHAAFATLVDRRAQLRAALAETERAAALRATLEDWFSRSGVAAPGYNRRSLLAAAATGSALGNQHKDVLSFITRAPTLSKGWSTTMIMYIDDNPFTPERGLTVRYLGLSSNENIPWLQLDNTVSILRRIGKSPAAYQLDDRVVGLQVEYLNPQTHRWISAQDAISALVWTGPSAIRITLEGAPSAPLPPLLQLPLYITWSGGLREVHQ